MALNVIRQQGLNVDNFSDVRAFRYGFGGYDGYVIGKGSEFAYNSGTPSIGTGEAVIQGWQVWMDSSFDLSTILINQGTATIFYTVYMEVAVGSSSVTASIKSSYSTTAYPTITSDDIGGNTIGTIRIILYHLTSVSGAVVLHTKVISSVPYISAKVNDLQAQISNNSDNIDILNEYSEGTIISEDPSITFSAAHNYKIGRIAILNITFTSSESINIKQFNDLGVFRVNLPWEPKEGVNLFIPGLAGLNGTIGTKMYPCIFGLFKPQDNWLIDVYFSRETTDTYVNTFQFFIVYPTED